MNTVIGTGGEVVYPVSSSNLPSAFFRVLFPQPVITAGEPARYAHGTGGSYLYITGQYFYSGDQVRVGGILANNAVPVSPSLLRVELPPGLPPGRHDVEILSNSIGAVLATLHEAVTVVNPVTDPDALLNSPPELPPASPMVLWASKRGYDYYKAASDNAASSLQTNPYFESNELSGNMALIAAWLSKKGYDYYQAQSSMAKTGLQNNPAFQQNNTQGTMPDVVGGFLSKKGYDYYQAQSALSYKIQEGKKGLNAVNVKLARTAGISNIGSSGQDGVSLFSGDVQQQVVDLAIEGRGLDFIWARTYHSRLGRTYSSATNGWTFSYDVSMQLSGEDVLIRNGTGRADRYIAQTNGVYTCPEFFCEGTLVANVFRLTFADTGYWEFRSLTAPMAPGKLDRIVDRNGNTISMNYDTNGRLVTIVDSLGRTYTVSYDTAGRLASVTDFSARTVRYEYDGNNDLIACISPAVTGTPNNNDFPNGKTNRYTYTSGSLIADENHLLTSCGDALGQTTAQFAYDLDPLSVSYLRCTSFQRGTHVPTMITYQPQTPAPENHFATLRCIVNDPVGNVTETFFDARNRGIEKAQIKRRAIPGELVYDTSALPIDKLRSEDPDLTVTRWSWNNDSLCTSETAPGGQVVSYTYQGDLDPSTPARKRADRRKVCEIATSAVDLDGDGSPDTSERIWQYTHDPRFGSDPSRKGWDGTVKGNIVDYRDDDCDGDSFVSSATDPLGNVTEADYDALGNRKNIRKNISVTLFTASFVHDAFGQLTAITNAPDAQGRSRVDTFAWSQGQLTECVIDAGANGLALTTAFEYDARGNVTRVVDPRGNDLLVTYNAINQPITVHKQTQGATFGERVKKTLFYDANNNLVRIDRDNRGPDGAFDPLNPQWTTTFEYDMLNRPIQVAHEVAHTVQQSVMTNQFVYNPNDQVTLHRLPEAVGGIEPNNVVAYSYDERGLLFSEARAPGTGLSTTDTFAYDANGNLVQTSKLDAFTSTQTLFAYDGFDRCVTTIDPMGNTASRAFDANDNLVYERTTGETDDRPGDKGNRKLAETRYTYDTLDRCLSRIDSFFDIFTEAAIDDGEATTTWTYAPNGQFVSRTDDNGATSAYTYDRAGRLASVTDPRGNVSSYAYDACGNVLMATQSDLSDVTAGQQVFTQTYTYDTLGRCITAIDNVGNRVQYAYDACNNLVSSTDPKGNETVCVYDGLGRVTDTTRYEGAKERGITINTSHVEYRNKRLVSSTDANTNTTAYAYDACDRLTQVTHADATVESLVWSPRSNLERSTDANGTTVTNSYDLCDRLIHRDIAVGAGVHDTTTFETFSYDGLGRLATAQNNGSTLVYAYDSLGNRVSSSQNGFVSTATFDGVRNRRNCTCPSGYRVHTTVDALNRPSSVSLQASAEGEPVTLATFAYDGADRLAKITRANNINTRIFWDGVQDTPNTAGDYGWQQVARINHARAGGGQIVDQRVSLYDRNQNKTTRAMTAPWTPGGSLVTNTYSYDALDRLQQSRKTGYVVAGDFNYVYDANGNRLQVTNNGVVEVYTMDPTLPDPADFQMNQYTDTPFGSEYHDARGNRVGRTNSARSLSYTYDYADRLVQVAELDPIGAYVPLATYNYDPLGRRISKTVFAGGGLPPVTTTFVYDDGKDDDCDGTPDDDVLEVYRGAAVSSVSVLAGGAGGGAAAASYAATGRMFAPPIGFLNAVGELFYTQCDDFGNMLALTDAAGSLVEHYDYDDFGVPSFFDASGTLMPSSSVGNDVLFGAMRWEEETELYHRDDDSTHYDPLTGQTLSRSKGTVKFFNETKGFGRIGSGSTTRAQDHNSSRSNGCGGPTRGQDHNSTRSNKTASRVDPDGGGGGGSGYTPVNLITPIAMDKGLRF
jgi:YD repeat-containing protein